jgi:hypothetical protein
VKQRPCEDLPRVRMIRFGREHATAYLERLVVPSGADQKVGQLSLYVERQRIRPQRMQSLPHQFL